MSFAAFKLNSFDEQKRNPTFVQTNFQVLKLKFQACNFKQAFYPLLKIHCVTLTTQTYFYISFSFGTWLLNLHV